MLTLVVTSDTHGAHDALVVPDGDVFIHAGDLSNMGDLAQIEEAAAWIRALPHDHKVVIPGNHDFASERQPEKVAPLFDGTEYLLHGALEIAGLKCFFSAFTPEFGGWAFMKPRSGRELRDLWAGIPNETELLVTHGPPKAILDRTFGGELAGCELLHARVQAVRPACHLFGHIHEARGVASADDTLFVNASASYSAEPPIVINIELEQSASGQRRVTATIADE